MIGDNIKFYRKKNQLTQDDIAEACNVTRQAVSKWENGDSFPDIGVLENLSGILDVKIQDIVVGEISADDTGRGKENNRGHQDGEASGKVKAGKNYILPWRNSYTAVQPVSGAYRHEW